MIYAGLWQSPEAVVRAVADEDAGWLGLSLLSGAHMTLVPRVLELLRQAGLADVGVLVGGIIPEEDVPKLIQLGVARVFGPGTVLERDRRVPPRAGTRGQSNRRAAPAGDRPALSRLIGGQREPTCSTQAAATAQLPSERRDEGAAADRARGQARVIAVTGSGGVGKSTLIGKLIEVIRQAGRSVAVLACDPQSPLTGGALAR